MNHPGFVLLSWVVLSVAFYCASARLSCKDESGSDADWYHAYKLANSFGLLYQDNKAPGVWKQASVPINADGNFIHRSVNPIYNDPSIGWILYSDQPPIGNDAPSSFAHAKGALLYSTDSAVYLIHSIPNFVSSPTKQGPKYEYPSTGKPNAQSMLCMTFSNPADAETIAKQMYNNKVKVYDKKALDAVDKTTKFLKFFQSGANYPRKGQTLPGAPPIKKLNDQYLITAGGARFRSISKNSDLADDMFSVPGGVSDLVGAPLQAETWRKGTGNWPNACKVKHPVYNVQKLKFAQFGIEIGTTSDHSKWSVSTKESGVKVFCIGDMNRQEGQRKRGGGMMCHENNPQVWKSYADIIAEVEPCKTSG